MITIYSFFAEIYFVVIFSSLYSSKLFNRWRWSSGFPLVYYSVNNLDNIAFPVYDFVKALFFNNYEGVCAKKLVFDSIFSIYHWKTGSFNPFHLLFFLLRQRHTIVQLVSPFFFLTLLCKFCWRMIFPKQNWNFFWGRRYYQLPYLYVLVMFWICTFQSRTSHCD